MRYAFARFAPSLFMAIMLFITATGCQEPPPPPPNPAETLAPIVEAYAAVWNTGDTAALDTLLTSTFVRHASANSAANGRDSLKQVITAFRTTYPDFNVALNEVVYSENRAAIRWSFTATNTGPGTIPATGKPVSLDGISVAHFADGMMTDEWVGADNAALMQQLGYTFQPPPAPRRRR